MLWTPERRNKMMTEETRRAFGLEDSQLLKWRMGGRSQKAKTFLLVAGVAVMILLGIRMLAGAPLPQYGGQRMRRPMTPEDQLARMTKQLQLTDEQQAKIKPIIEEQHKQMMDLRQDTSMSREDRFAKFREIRQKSFEKMKTILTPEQQKKWQEMQQMRRGRRGGPRPN
jgi:Spy/CpxP family protein refolding chaperone